jgi:MipA family protein
MTMPLANRRRSDPGSRGFLEGRARRHLRSWTEVSKIFTARRHRWLVLLFAGAFVPSAWGADAAASPDTPTVPRVAPPVIAPYTPPAPVDPPPRPEDKPENRYRYALGLAVVADQTGSVRSGARLRALGAYNFGWVRISTSYIGSILTFGADERERGAIADLYQTRRWSAGAGLRMDSGSRPGMVREIPGLPEVKRTLRASFYVRYDFDERWRARLTLLPDLLGRQEGVAATLGVSYTTRLTQSTEGSAFTSVAFGDRRHLQTYFGVSDALAQQSGLPAFRPGGSVSEVQVGTSLIHAFHRRWIVFGGVGASRLVGAPAKSPLLHSRWGSGVYAGFGYRCC